MHEFATKICLTVVLYYPNYGAHLTDFQTQFETFSIILRKMGFFLSHQMIRTFLKTFFIVSYFDNAMLCNQFHQLLHQIAPQNWCDCAEKLEKRRLFTILGLHCDNFFSPSSSVTGTRVFQKVPTSSLCNVSILQKSIRCWKDVLIKPLLKWPPQILNPLNLIYTSYLCNMS